jgi:phenylalanyl-tRNA synthetase alpha chain
MDLEQIILTELFSKVSIEDSWDFATSNGVEHQSVVGVVKSLLGDAFVKDEPLSKSIWQLTEEGEKCVSDGSPEFIVFSAVAEGDEGTTIESLNAQLGDIAKVGMGPCMKNKWLKKNGANVVRAVATITDKTADLLRALRSGEVVDEKELVALKKRKLLQQTIRKSLKVTKGPAFSMERKKKMNEITKEMLGEKAEMAPGTHWSDVTFKDVNIKAMGRPVGGGNFHPLLKVRAEFRRILMQMGFEEMPTSKWVESSFWNFDSLFQPQSHPARDAHDTFFIKSPAACNSMPSEYYERVRQVHEQGGYGSLGYGQGSFKKEEAQKNILRTHTTAISAQMLYKLANQPGGFTPKKYFSVDRVFRNEAMDATHLCEFHQVEGMIADYDLSLGNLIHTIRSFFEAIGITQVLSGGPSHVYA